MLKFMGLGIVVLLAALGASHQVQAAQRATPTPASNKGSSSKNRGPASHAAKARHVQMQSKKPAGHVVTKSRGLKPSSGPKMQEPVRATPKKGHLAGLMKLQRRVPVAATFGYSASSEDRDYNDFDSSFDGPEVVDDDYAHSFDADWSQPQEQLNGMAVQGYQLQFLKKAGLDRGDTEMVDLMGAGAEDYEPDMVKTRAADRQTGGQMMEKRNFLFEALNEGFYEPQHVMKRGGLSAFDRPTSPDPDFMGTLKRFLGNLLQKTSIPDISKNWLPRQGEKAHRTDKLTARWKSVDCATLDMRLRVVGSIYEGHRNQVLKLQDRNTQRLYAYKTYGNQDEFYAELEMFLWLDHPLFIKAVCQLRDAEAGKAGILFDYVDGMTSMSYARTATAEQLQKMSAQLFLAVEHLHWLGIVHADLKPENVLVARDGTIQVIDFGFAVHLPQSRKRRGTHTTMAPELHSLVPGRVHEGIDWWAYGSTVGMWYGFNENYRISDTGRFIPMDWKDFQYVAGQIPWKFTPELRSFMHIFFQPHPESRKLNNKRLLRQIREQPFFEGFDWSSQVGGTLE